MKVQVTFKDEKAIEIIKRIPRGLKGIALERALLEAIKKPTYAKLFLGEEISTSTKTKSKKQEKTPEKQQSEKQIEPNDQDEFSNW